MRYLAFVLGVIVLPIVASVPGIAAGPFDQKLSKDMRAVHALNRLTFGPRPGDIEQVRRLGVEKWIEQQLYPERISESTLLTVKLLPLETLGMESWQILDKYTTPAAAARARREAMGQPPLLTASQRQAFMRGTIDERRDLLESFDDNQRIEVLATIPFEAVIELPEFRRQSMAARQPPQFVHSELIDSKLFRAIYSNRQLEEVLIDFWLNHFNVFNGKGPGRVLLTSYERDAIRPHVLGRFKDMLLATARHPAMLFYLDNWQSQAPRDETRPQQPGPGRRAGGLNENYGRELMELHTLGVDGGYTQQDVIAVARAFTGWTIYDVGRVAEFQFNPAVHDRKEKVVLGHTIPAGGGEKDGLQVLDILASHPSTAKFISKKLAQRFVADEPPQSLIDRMAATFTRTDGDLREVLRTMFTSREFFSEGAWQTKLKSPLELVVSAVRTLGANVVDAFVLAQKIADLGQPLYGKSEPTGYPNTGESWASTAGLLARFNFASDLVEGRISGVTATTSRFAGKNPSSVALDLMSVAPSREMQTTIEKGLQGKTSTPAILAALVIASPDFQRR